MAFNIVVRVMLVDVELRFDGCAAAGQKVRFDAELVKIRQGETGVTPPVVKGLTWDAVKAMGLSLQKFDTRKIEDGFAHFYTASGYVTKENAGKLVARTASGPNLHEDQSGEGAKSPMWTG